MNKLSRSLLGVCLAISCSCIAAAQENPQAGVSIPKVLQIFREYTKPGKSGMVHEKTESAFVQAMTRAKWPTHYLAMTSLSGKSCALFLTHYASFEAWEKDNVATEKNTALAAALDRAAVVDGELLDSVDSGAFIFRDDLSLRTMADLSHMRYLSISIIHLRPGHTREWTEAVKMVKAAYEKVVPEAHWGMFQQVYGGSGFTFLELVAHKTLAEVDRLPQERAQFEAAMGEDGMKKLAELVSASVESSSHQLFAFNPRMSYVPDEWIKADPDFWKPKAVTAPAAKPATAPAAKPATEEKKEKP
jgi:hypothetical protein